MCKTFLHHRWVFFVEFINFIEFYVRLTENLVKSPQSPLLCPNETVNFKFKLRGYIKTRKYFFL